MAINRTALVFAACLAYVGFAFQPSTPRCGRTALILQRAEPPREDPAVPAWRTPPKEAPGWLKQLNKLGAKLSLRDAAWRKSLTDETDDLSLVAYEGRVNGPAQAALRALASVVAAETSRAKRVVADVERGGSGFVRPKDAPVQGPLGKAEREAVLVLQSLVAAEKERARSGKRLARRVRPLEQPHPEMLGLLGELERDTANALARLVEEEKRRVASGLGPYAAPSDADALTRGASDAEGPTVLGELERQARALVGAEVERLNAMLAQGSVSVRPMDVPGAEQSPLAQAERAVLATADAVRAYELARLDQLRAKGLLPSRPMDVAPNSLPGLAERVGVGLLRAPLVVERVVARTAELLRAADGAADAEMASRQALEQKVAAQASRRQALSDAAAGADRAPVLLEAVARRTKELLEEGDTNNRAVDV